MKYISVRTQVEAELIDSVMLDSYDKDTGTMAVILANEAIVRVTIAGQPKVGDFFIFEDNNPMGGYHCPLSVFVTKYQPAEQLLK